MRTIHKVFISYHHDSDQSYKEELIRLNEENNIFIDGSVNTGEINDENLSDESIREKIRDEYLRDTTVTILLVGKETKNRKHVDWELYSSMFDGKKNSKSGVLVVLLPEVKNYIHAGHGLEEKEKIYPEIDKGDWVDVGSKSELEQKCPYLPSRIIDSLVTKKSHISVVNWNKLTLDNLIFLIEVTHRDRKTCEYDLSTKMRRNNS